MSHTNETLNYQLPQFVGSDKPAWLTDINGAFSDIDAAIYAAKSEADTNAGNISDLGTTVAGHTQTLSDQGDAITGLRTDVNGNTGSINTINSLIGNGEPTTTDKTLIGAINEVNADVGTLETTVGDNSSGLVKDVNDLKTEVGSLTTIAEVFADGVKDRITLLTELYNLVSSQPINVLAKSKLMLGESDKAMLVPSLITSTGIYYTHTAYALAHTSPTGATVDFRRIVVSATTPEDRSVTFTTVFADPTNVTTNYVEGETRVPPVGFSFRIAV